MEKIVSIPEGVTVEVEGKRVKVSGEKGGLEREFKYFWDIKIEKKDDEILVSSPSDRRKVKAMVGTICSHLQNMMKGVKEGFEYKMKIVYSHFPVTIKVEGDKVQIHNFLGEKLPRIAKALDDTQIEVKGQDITVRGIDKENVAQTCANIEMACRITKQDRRVFQDGIFIVEKGK